MRVIFLRRRRLPKAGGGQSARQVINEAREYRVARGARHDTMRHVLLLASEDVVVQTRALVLAPAQPKARDVFVRSMTLPEIRFLRDDHAYLV